MKAEPVVASIHINAPPEHVFEHFVSPEAVVGWMGDYALLEPKPGGRFVLDINGVPVRGAYLELERPRRLLISWGHAGSEAAAWLEHRRDSFATRGWRHARGSHTQRPA